jgi:flagellar motor switch protein FliM
MTAPNQITENENAANQPIDPFAVDFFGGKHPVSDDGETFSEKTPQNKKRIKAQKKSDWYKNLPRITNREAEFSNLLSNLPESLADNAAKVITETLAHYTFSSAETVRCSLVSVAETNLNNAVNRLLEPAQIFLAIGCQSENSPAITKLDTEFASALIDSMLGGNGSEPGNRRELSPIETTIIEFVAAHILGEINRFLGEPMLFLQSVKNEPISPFSQFERGAELIFELEFGDFKGIVKAVVPQRFLSSLNKSQNPLLVKKSGRKKLHDFEKIVRRLDLRLQIGTTFLGADSLLFLEPDDIVLIEQPLISLENENFGANLQVCVGRGRNVRFRGNARNDDFSENLNFKIEEILSEEARRRFTPAKFKMDERENESAEQTKPASVESPVERSEETSDEQISPSLENIQVALRVEIAGDKISLRELQNLRAGQIIALGCAPTDPVRLVTDQTDEPVATGELVEIEGQLGVRLTKVFI